MTMTKATLATTLFEQIGLNKREANDLVDRFFEEMSAALEAHDFVKLSGFGNFTLREKPSRPGRNPKTGQQIPILARRVVTFHPSSKLRALIKPLTRYEHATVGQTNRRVAVSHVGLVPPPVPGRKAKLPA